MNEYTVIVGVESDKRKKRFEPGDVVNEKDFPKSVIENWVKKGVLFPMQEKQKDINPEEVDDGGDA